VNNASRSCHGLPLQEQRQLCNRHSNNSNRLSKVWLYPRDSYRTAVREHVFNALHTSIPMNSDHLQPLSTLCSVWGNELHWVTEEKHDRESWKELEVVIIKVRLTGSHYHEPWRLLHIQTTEMWDVPMKIQESLHNQNDRYPALPVNRVQRIKPFKSSFTSDLWYFLFKVASRVGFWCDIHVLIFIPTQINALLRGSSK